MSGTGNLAGKTAIVTGSSQGIGQAIAIRMAAAGAHVAVNYFHDEQGANATRERIEQQGGRAIVVQADVGAAADAQRLIDTTVQAFGGLDILVNNAGVEIRNPFLDVSEQDWDLVLTTNLKGPFLCAQAAVRAMLKRNRPGRIINVSSIHEDVPMPGNSPYCAAKGGLRMLMRTLCDELAPHGITINNIAPGAIATPINKATLADSQKVATLNAYIPLGRLGTPDDVASVAVFLASDDAAYVTGATYVVDGGMTRHALAL